MITWTSGKAAIAGGWKTLIRGVFSYRYSATSEAPESENVTSYFVLPVTARPIMSAVTARRIGATMSAVTARRIGATSI